MFGTRIAMMQGTKALRLVAIVEAIGRGDWVWRFLEFSGVGVAPRGMTMLDFEQEVRSRGFSMTSGEFGEFARSIEQVWNCLIVGLDKQDTRPSQQIAEQAFAGALVIIEGVDSTDWEIKSQDAIWLKQFAAKIGAQPPKRTARPS